MNCESFLELLQLELDGGTSLEAHEHLRVCLTCRELYRAAGLMRNGVQRLSWPAPPAGLMDRIVLRAIADRRVLRRRRWITAGLAVAAALFIAVGATLFWPAEQPEPNGSSLPLAQIDEGREPTVNLNQSVTDVGAAVVALTNRATQETVGQTKVLLPIVAGPVLDELDLELVGPTLSLREASEGLSAGLEPVTTSAKRAVGLLLRDLTPMETDTKRGL